MKRAIVLVVCAALAGGCATGGRRQAAGPAPGQQAATRGLMGEYVQRLPVGARVRVERTAGSTLKGTLLKATGESIVVQRRTRFPEPPIEVPIAEVRQVSLETSSGTARAIGIGLAAGAAGALGFFVVLLAIYSD